MRPAVRGEAIGVTIRCLVNPFDEITCLLEFNRKKESSRDVNALQLNTRLICTAGSNLIRPEVEAALVRLAIQKTQIMGADKDVRRVDQIWPIREVVIGDRDGGLRRRANESPRRISKLDVKGFGTFQV